MQNNHYTSWRLRVYYKYLDFNFGFVDRIFGNNLGATDFLKTE